MFGLLAKDYLSIPSSAKRGLLTQALRHPLTPITNCSRAIHAKKLFCDVWQSCEPRGCHRQLVCQCSKHSLTPHWRTSRQWHPGAIVRFRPALHHPRHGPQRPPPVTAPPVTPRYRLPPLLSGGCVPCCTAQEQWHTCPLGSGPPAVRPVCGMGMYSCPCCLAVRVPMRCRPYGQSPQAPRRTARSNAPTSPLPSRSAGQSSRLELHFPVSGSQTSPSGHSTGV